MKPPGRIVDDEIVVIEREIEHVVAEIEAFDVEPRITARLDVDGSIALAADLPEHGGQAALRCEMQDPAALHQAQAFRDVEGGHPGALQRAAIGTAHPRALGHVGEGGTAADIALHGAKVPRRTVDRNGTARSGPGSGRLGRVLQPADPSM